MAATKLQNIKMVQIDGLVRFLQEYSFLFNSPNYKFLTEQIYSHIDKRVSLIKMNVNPNKHMFFSGSIICQLWVSMNLIVFLLNLPTLKYCLALSKFIMFKVII